MNFDQKSDFLPFSQKKSILLVKFDIKNVFSDLFHSKVYMILYSSQL